MEAVEAHVCDLMIGQRFGDDADDPTSRGKDGVCHRAHESDRGTPVDQPHTSIGELGTEFHGRGGE
jgi:hypothetical protein